MATGSQAGTGTAGANQNAPHPTGPATGPSEVIAIPGPLDQAAALPKVSIDYAGLAVKTAYDLDFREAQRINLVMDQFATEGPTRLTQNGQVKQITFEDDLAEATLPLLQNLDIDTVAMTGRYMQMRQYLYGNAARWHVMLDAVGMVPYNSRISRKIALNAVQSQDALAYAAFGATSLTMYNPDDTTLTGTVGSLRPLLASGSAGYLTTDVLQEGMVMLSDQNAEPFYGQGFDGDGRYVLLTGARGKQHLEAETIATGYRDAVQRNEGMQGNDLFRGSFGVWNGCEVVVSRRIRSGVSLLFGREAFAKTFPGVDGWGPMPEMVTAPTNDTLRVFAAVGWRWIGGYSLFRPMNVVRITHGTTNRALGATNASLSVTAYAEA